jgi:hypothetical protein
MDQALFDKLTAGSGAVYVPSSQSPKYELVAIAVTWGATNNRIRVSVKNEEGSDAFNTFVRHSFGGDKERFPFVGNPVEFNLGVGSHYSQPDPPPDRITVEGLASDEVQVGNADIIGFAHTEWQMTFKRMTSTPVTPITPDPTPTSVVAALRQALAKQRVLAINDQTALFKYATAHASPITPAGVSMPTCGSPQTDEFPFTFGGIEYVGQMYTYALLYCKKGDTATIWPVAKESW